MRVFQIVIVVLRSLIKTFTISLIIKQLLLNLIIFFFLFIQYAIVKHSKMKLFYCFEIITFGNK